MTDFNNLKQDIKQEVKSKLDNDIERKINVLVNSKKIEAEIKKALGKKLLQREYQSLKKILGSGNKARTVLAEKYFTSENNIQTILYGKKGKVKKKLNA